MKTAHHPGRPRTSTRIFENHCHCIDAMKIIKTPGFKPSFHYEYLPDVINPVITQSVALQWNDGTQTSVELVTTHPNFGGTRYWFKCPHCVRRVRKLYSGSELGFLACRTCFGLVYESQYRKGPRFELFRQIRRLMACPPHDNLSTPF